VVAVPPELSAEPVQTFQSFTGDLYRLATWLVEIGVTTVAMESTGIYWIPVFDILEAHGLEVLLVNARHVKTVPGRKTDVNDAQWLQQLHTYGLLRGSFHPAQDWSALRVYLRHRERLVEYAAAHIQHMQKAASIRGSATYAFRGGLRGAGASSTASKTAANIERGFRPKKRSAAVVPSGRVRKKL
jgi:transposase